jgi:hypothetical protein
VTRIIAALLFACAAAQAAAAEDTVRPADYAWRFPVRLSAASDVHVLTLTPEVYRSVFDSALGDLRLIDASGREVSFGPLPAAQPERWRQTPWVMQMLGARYEPVPDAAPRAFPGPLERSDDRIELDRGEYVARLTLGVRTNQRQRVPIRALDVDWSSSRDLPAQTRWWVESHDGFAVLPARTASRYDRTGARGRTRLSFDAEQLIATGDLRIRAEPLPSGLSIDTVFAEYEPDPGFYRDSIAATPFRFADLEGSAQGFVLDGPYPVHAAAIELDPGDALASVQLFARDAGAPWWQGLGATTAFDVTVSDAKFERGRIVFDPTRHRQWMLSSTPALHAPPKLTLHYRPDRFLIAHRGPGELTLLAGHRSARRQAYPVSALIDDLRSRLGDRWEPEPANIGARVEVLGAAALAPPEPPPPYRQWLLWSALVVAAAMISAMAVKLLRESGDGNG